MRRWRVPRRTPEYLERLPVEPSPSAAGAMHESGRGRWIGLGMLSLGVAMIIVDATIVNVAVPSIIAELDLDSTTAEWINTVYALVFAALLITLGRIGDLFGRRRLYLLGLVVFGAASVLAGAAPTGELLIAARVLQGIGGAMILPATQSILNTNFRGRDRAIAFGIWGATIGGMAALGPLLGGWLTTNISWRWAFYINVPVAIIAFLGTRHYIGESKDENAKAGLDPAGFILITAGLSAIVFALIEGRTYGWWTPEQPFTIGGWTWPLENRLDHPVPARRWHHALVVFAVVEHASVAGRQVLPVRRGPVAVPRVPVREPRGHDRRARRVRPAVRAARCSSRPSSATRRSRRASCSSRSRSARSWPRRSPRASRTRTARGASSRSAWRSRPSASSRPRCSSRSTCTGLQLGIPLFVYGIGVGLATAQLTSIVLSDIPAERSGLASGANSTMRQVGSALGIAILGTVLFTSLGNGVTQNLSEVPGLPPAAVEGIADAMEASAGQALTGIREQPGLGGDRAAARGGLRGRDPTGRLRRHGVRAAGRRVQPVAAEDAAAPRTRRRGADDLRGGARGPRDGGGRTGSGPTPA